MKSNDTKWRNASEDYRGTHDIKDFINDNFPNKAGLDVSGYSENSRETFRKQTIKPWISAGILEAKAGLSTNDKGNSYRFTSYFAALIRTYGTNEWNEKLKDYNETHESYSNYLKQEKRLVKDYEYNYNDEIIRLKKTPHNLLQIEIIDKLFPLISKKKPELLYIGDATDRDIIINEKRMTELGINVFSDSKKLPDIVAYDKTNNRILFIEACYSGGEFSLDRVNDIKKFCKCKEGTEAAFITAFDTTRKMLKTYTKVAWDTEMWSADEPTHLVHKNGDIFIGRKL